jgi:ubiquinone/menaquinone biosynthesis C-methylase UbiE
MLLAGECPKELSREDMLRQDYVHGYDPLENQRLQDQAGTLAELLHADTVYSDGRLVLEAGCGVGAQTVTLAQRSPTARFISIDRSADSLGQAKKRTSGAGVTNVEFYQADIFALPYADEFFDHVFVCFVLEHLSRPAEALVQLRRVLRTGGTMTVIEGDHRSAYFHPESNAADAAIQCLIELQRQAGGNALIGRQLYPLLKAAGFDELRVTPRFVYVDASRPELVEGFTRKTFTAMVGNVREAAIARGLLAQNEFDAGLRDLERTTRPDGVFCYTFFKGVAIKGRPT